MTTDERFDRIEALILSTSKSTNDRLDHTDLRFASMDARFDRMDRRFDAIDARFDRMDQHFDAIDARLDRMDQRFDGIDARFDRMDGRLDGMDQRFNGIDIRFNRIDDRFERVDSAIERFSRHTTERFQTLTQYVSDLRDESTMRLDLIDSRMGLMNLTLANIDPSARLPGLTKSVMDTSAAASKLALEVSKQKADFGDRLAKLEETVARLHDSAA